MGIQGGVGRDGPPGWLVLLGVLIVAGGMAYTAATTPEYRPPERVAKVVAKKHAHTGPAFLVFGAESRYFLFARDGTSVRVDGYTFNRIEVGQVYESAGWADNGERPAGEGR